MILTSRDREAVQNHQRTVILNLRALRQFLVLIRRELKLQRAELHIRFISDAEMRRLNKTYRRQDKPTDVLSFPVQVRRSPVRGAHSIPKVRKQQALGDIAVSPATARRYAKKHGRSLLAELRILMLHGVLHLLGYDHEADNGEMDRTESRLRRRLGLTW